MTRTANCEYNGQRGRWECMPLGEESYYPVDAPCVLLRKTVVSQENGRRVVWERDRCVPLYWCDTDKSVGSFDFVCAPNYDLFCDDPDDPPDRYRCIKSKRDHLWPASLTGPATPGKDYSTMALKVPVIPGDGE